MGGLKGKEMIVVCGEALMDVFDAGATASGHALDARIGGSPYNVALGLARLAQPVGFCGAVSTGFLGERLMRSLADEGIDTRCVQRTTAPTSVCIVGLDVHGVPAYDFYGERGADRQLDASQALAAVPASTRALQFGSYAMVVEPVAAAQRALVEREHRRGASGALIAYDPNVRLVVEPDVARWRATLDWMLPRTHLLKISDEDLALLHPGLAAEDAAAHWLAQGVRTVVVTRGAEGALAFCGSARAEVPPVKVTVVDTVGAGDTFQAALLTWLAEHERLSVAGVSSLDMAALEAMLGFAARAAAITCSRRGADLPRRAELA
jgi:fructokinase